MDLKKELIRSSSIEYDAAPGEYTSMNPPDVTQRRYTTQAIAGAGPSGNQRTRWTITTGASTRQSNNSKGFNKGAKNNSNS